jgi:hypothetical protein
MNLRTCRLALWFALVASGALIVWQVVAFLSGRIPDHMLPLVRRLSGEHEALAVAYTWTLRLGLLSVVTFAVAGFALGWLHFTRKHPA